MSVGNTGAAGEFGFLEMRSDIEMKPNERDPSQRINELGGKATQLLTLLGFAIVAAI